MRHHDTVAKEALPELELEELMQQRPLQLRLGSTSTSPQMRLCDTVRQKGVAKCRAISEQTAQEVLEFMCLEPELTYFLAC